MLQQKTPRQKRLMLFLFVLFGLLLTKEMKAQQGISIVWDKETGCLVYDDKKREYTEEIEDGPCVRVCENSTVTYSLTGDSSGWVDTNWTIAGGSIVGVPTLTSVTVQWGASGWATVSATITKNDDTVQTEEICVEVIISPTAHFGIMPDINADYVEACDQETLYFVNNSITNNGTGLIAYYWDFDDGTTSSEFEPQHMFPGPGTYHVTLTVTNACNCTSTHEMKVNVKHGGFEIVCPSVVCDGERASYSLPADVVAGCSGTGYNWTVSGGTIVSSAPYGPSILVDWDQVDATGFGYVTFDATGCDLECAGITTIQVPVIQSTGTIIGETVVCQDEQNIYKLPQWPSTVFNWTLDDNGTGATIINSFNTNEVVVQTFGNPGTITLHATYTNTLLNCGGIATLVIDIRPRADLSGPTGLCLDETGHYEIAGGYTGNWTLTGPIGTVSATAPTFDHDFTVAGNYSLTVAGTTFCRSTQMAIVVRPKEQTPTAITGPGFACPSVPEIYSVNNTIAGTQIGWAVVNGTIDGSNYGNEVSVSFGPTGPYIVKAWRENVSSPNCVSDTITKTVTLPVVAPVFAGSTMVCASTYANYNVDYLDGEDYTWTIDPFIAGSVSQGNGTSQVEILWNQYSGPATIHLAIKKCGVYVPTDFQYGVTVITTPNVSLSNPPTQICHNDSLNLTLVSSPALTQGTITWNFGDGTILTSDASLPGGLSMSHPYTTVNAGSLNYNIVITVTGANGCINPAVINHSIIVLPSPVASITPGGNYTICPTMSPQALTVNIQGGLSAVTNIEWFKTPSTVPVLSGPTADTYSATAYGSYYAVVTGTNGCTTTTNTVTFNGNCSPIPPCTVNETVILNTPVNNCGTVTVSASATGSPSAYNWYTSTTPTSQSTSPTGATFTFAESGTYTIYYQVTYNNCIVTRSQTVLVPYKPELRYTITCGSAGNYTVTLLDNSNYFPGHPITSHIFSIDSNTYPMGSATSYMASLPPGTYSLGLTIDGTQIEDDPCSVTPITIVLPAMPNANFTHDAPRCEDAVVHFTAPLPTQPNLTYSWNFDDGASNLQQNPEKVYLNPTPPGFPYNVTLTVTNQYGCSTSVTQPVNIRENLLEGELIASATTACEGTPVSLTYNNLGIDTPQTYSWMKGNQQIAVTTSPSINVTQSGSYWVRIESLLGCVLTNIDPVVITFVKAPVANISGQEAVCVNSNFTLSTPTVTNATYVWIVDGAHIPAFDNLTSISQIFYTTGYHTYQVTVSIPNGIGGFCESTDVHDVTVYPNPAVPTISVTPLDCATYTFKLNAYAPGTGTYTWSNGDSGPDTTVSAGGTYQVRFTSPSGCSTTQSVIIPKDPAIYLWTVPDGCYAFCKEVLSSVSITGPVNVFPQWSWLYNGGTVESGTNSAVTPIEPASYGPGTYQLVLDNGYCPRVSDEVTIDDLGSCNCKLEVKVIDVKRVIKEFCYYEFYFQIFNPYGPLQVTVTLPNGQGILVPTTVTAPNGYSTHMVTVIPLGGFSGGSVAINFEAMLDIDKPCLTSIKVEFPPCSEGHKLGQFDDKPDNLVISPNPASNVVRLSYTYADSKDSDTRSLEIYSLMGVQLESYSPKEAEGTWQPDLGHYPAGQYIIVMRLNGSLLLQKNLILQ
jgi:PKD repeat protein